MKRAIQIVVLLAIAGAVVFGVVRMRGGSASKTQYRVAAANVGNLRRTVSATGTLQPWTTVDIKSKAGGRVDELDVDVGSIVKAGQIIAKIDPTDSLLTYNQAKADTDSAQAKESQSDHYYRLQVSQSKTGIEQAEAAVGVARANVSATAARLQTAKDEFAAQPKQTAAAIAQAKANYDSLVQQRAQLTQTQEQDRAAAKAAFDQAAANDKNAQANLARQRSLYEQGFVAASDLDSAAAAAGVTSATLATARAKLDTLAMEQQAVADSTDAKVKQALEAWKAAMAQPDVKTKLNAVSEAKAAYDQAAAQLRQSEAQLEAAKASTVNNPIKALDITSAKAGTSRAEAALSNAKTTLDQTTVRAPSEGVVLQKYVEQGTIITSGLSLNSTGTSIVQLGDVTKMYVYVLVDETDIGSVCLGQKVDVSVDAYPDVPFQGRVSRIDPQAQVQQNVTSVGVRVEIDNSEPHFKSLKPAMNATCEFVVSEKDRVLSIPSDAVQSDSEGHYVQVVVSPPAAKPKPGSRRTSAEEIVSEATPEKRRVETGFQGDENTEIVSGLKEGERVVVQTIAATSTTTQRQSSGSPFGGRGMGGPPPGGPPPGGR